jgi:hypothetical protein
MDRWKEILNQHGYETEGVSYAAGAMAEKIDRMETEATRIKTELCKWIAEARYNKRNEHTFESALCSIGITEEDIMPHLEERERVAKQAEAMNRKELERRSR